MKQTLIFIAILLITLASCKQSDNDSETEQWEVTINIDITEPDPSPFTAYGDVEVTISGTHYTMKGTFTIGNQTHENIILEGTYDGMNATMTTDQIEVQFEFDGTTYTENISWEMESFEITPPNASGHGNIQAIKTPGNIVETGTYTFTAIKK